MKVLYLGSIFFLIISCNNNNFKTKKRINNKIIESIFINDSICDGVAKFYDLNSHLESKIYFTKGVKNGVALNYHSNGRVFDSSNYKNGYKNGLHYVFDSTGQLIYVDYYFDGHQFGSQTFFRNNKPYQYIFKSFEKKNIFSCEYDSIGMSAYNGEVINANLYTATVNAISGYGFFAYFLSPPNIQILYSLGIKEQKTNTQKEICILDNKRIFIDTILNIPPSGWKYYISAKYNDTSNNLKKIYFSVLEY